MAYKKAASKTKASIEKHRAIADRILNQAMQQLTTSRQFKRQRFQQISENENLYLGVIEKSIKNPYNECFPFMAGFVDHLKSRIDDDSALSFTHTAEADLKRVRKIQAFWDMESENPDPKAMWGTKHRHAKTNAVFSGVAIYKYYSEKNPDYKSCLEVISHYDFHCEPRGGALLENHLFCGQDNIYKNTDDLEDSEYYDKEQVTKLVTGFKNNEYKDTIDTEDNRDNRYRALNQDPQVNSYVGQGTVKLVEWYTTFKGKRYYILFSEAASTWIRCVPLNEMFPDELYPYIAWHTNEDPDVFWSKAPCDDARPVARIINTMVNQELYNRQKRNYGQRGYDAEMFPNVAALADWRPDGLVPVDTKLGTRSIGSGVYEFKVGDLNGTLDLVNWLEGFTGKQMGNTPSSMGSAEKDKKVGVFYGEIEQVDKLINVKNVSYRTALSQLGLRFKQGLEHNLDRAVSVKMMGAKGIEWEELSPEELETNKEIRILPKGGVSEMQLERAKNKEKAATLKEVQTVNPEWKDRMLLTLNGFDNEDIKDAFSIQTFAEKELMSEAAQAEQDIVEGKTPAINRGATPAFLQHIKDFAVNTNDLTTEQFDKLMEYMNAHIDIAIENVSRNINEMLTQKAKTAISTSYPQGGNGGQARPGQGIINTNVASRIPTENIGSTSEVPIA